MFTRVPPAPGAVTSLHMKSSRRLRLPIAQLHRCFCFSLVAAGVMSGLAATSPFARADPLDDEILALMRSRKVPGLSLAIVQDGKIVRAQGYGVIETGSSA